MPSPHRLVLIPLVALAAAALTACTPAPVTTPDSDASLVELTPPTDVESTVEPDPTGEPTGVAAWCALVPPSLVQQALGIALRSPSASFTSDEIRCRYDPVEEGGLTIDVRFRPEQDHDDFVAYRASNENDAEPPIDLVGVGDEAYYIRSEFDSLVAHTVVARRGSVIVSIEVPGTLEQASALVQGALSNLA